MNALEQDISSYVAQELLEEKEGQLPPETVLLNGLLDSWAMMQLVYWLEETYDLTIEMEELVDEHFETIGAVAAFVQRKQTSQQAS